MTERVNRDMHLAETLYQIKLRESRGSPTGWRSTRSSPRTWRRPGRATRPAGAIIDRQIANKVTVLALGGNHFIAVLDADGNVLAGSWFRAPASSAVAGGGNWAGLPIVKDALSEAGRPGRHRGHPVWTCWRRSGWRNRRGIADH